ncbi:MAG: hypothetical protein ACPGUE_19960 [Marinomonas sp.]|jgi:xanthosine utilization system XapX-like protein|uniref:hypothetical protein n=1 Tax=unclassified Marinomonas TaxID=196814 RepID=UPI0005FA861C|nr:MULTISPECIES: hypothetical protein [unclassified Marinomonas]KJZ15754.1 hypothetical protein TW85_02305 [Marinomonas sp. S3726]KZM40268.1 hypothetical protein OA92_17120 [Marinomonas sp. SBI22]KZM41685.1 hypothetical protein OA91_16355 [Marinomonas sp. SBI8L]
MKKYAKPLAEGLAVGIVFVSITMLFQIPYYMSAIIGVLAAIGGFRNSIKMDAEKKAKKSAPASSEIKTEKKESDDV